ncbi:hypothetical protein THAOC_09130 [Thalassiosira oceanica]|uniref:Uncharacterized protein n=1 Tax=Thalassiosira oceanica TaxID=159749 RepID=K0T8C0_THAOC|nr:hypothetical protein THAOC_09130 [Thalassiosira oceanica]|eukprot:EJK69596.1 hypothetical protein THAOC_09130 [Thalassiosira oceanica]
MNCDHSLAFGHHRAQAPALQDSKHGRDSSASHRRAEREPILYCWMSHVAVSSGNGLDEEKIKEDEEAEVWASAVGGSGTSRGMATANTATADTSRLMCASRDDDGRSTSRRRAVASAASLLALQTLAAQPAFALKERNEALCSTGFFTNVGAWYCTDIGNIGDEGKSKDLSKEAETTIDSLMGKFEGDASSSSEPSDPKSEIKEQDKS